MDCILFTFAVARRAANVVVGLILFPVAEAIDWGSHCCCSCSDFVVVVVVVVKKIVLSQTGRRSCVGFQMLTMVWMATVFESAFHRLLNPQNQRIFHGVSAAAAGEIAPFLA